ncbi:MAG: hypothetical protein QG576_516, partial [Bacteroidota bacterium]|nr:hypothetical protein [Bacteroidota bacterium]
MGNVRKFRNLSSPEIKTLTANSCKCDNWDNVKVMGGFDPSRCFNTTFTGTIRLGNFNKTLTDESGVSIRCGISNAHLHNCTIGSNVLISNIGDYIANYNIEDEVVIKNCGKIYTEGIS